MAFAGTDPYQDKGRDGESRRRDVTMNPVKRLVKWLTRDKDKAAKVRAAGGGTADKGKQKRRRNVVAGRFGRVLLRSGKWITPYDLRLRHKGGANGHKILARRVDRKAYAAACRKVGA